MRILSGIQPSGKLHIGNYFGMMKPAIELQQKGEAYLFIADYHSLTQLPNPEDLRMLTEEAALDFLACGIHPEKTVFFKQSSVPEITELTWILSCITPMGLLERCHSYKDKIAKGISANHGLFAYPVLMASDILIYNSDLVPVGRDQKQHVEVTADIAQKFNHRYGETFIIPKEKIMGDVAVVPGTDGQKMSKSYNNTINIFGTEKQIRKTIMKVVTDSTALQDPKDADNCNVFALYNLFANKSEEQRLKERYQAGGMGYGHAKQELFEKFWEYFRPFRKKREELSQNMDYIQDILKKGGEKARQTASTTLDKVKKATGL